MLLEGEKKVEDMFKRWMSEIQRNGPKVCFICGESDPAVMKRAEAHHIHGRSNSPVVVTLCLNCHQKITYHQNDMPPKSRSLKSGEIEKALFQLTSQGALLKVLGESTIKLAERLRKNG